MNAAITIFQPIDGRVELIVTANGHHQKLAGEQIMSWQFVDRKVGAAGRRLENAFARWTGQVKPAPLTHSFIVLFKAGDDVLDVIADAIVIGDEFFPVDRGALLQRGPRQSPTMVGSLKSCVDAGVENLAKPAQLPSSFP